MCLRFLNLPVLEADVRCYRRTHCYTRFIREDTILLLVNMSDFSKTVTNTRLIPRCPLRNFKILWVLDAMYHTFLTRWPSCLCGKHYPWRYFFILRENLNHCALSIDLCLYLLILWSVKVRSNHRRSLEMYVKVYFDARCYLTAVQLFTHDLIRRMLTASQGYPNL